MFAGENFSDSIKIEIFTGKFHVHHFTLNIGALGCIIKQMFAGNIFTVRSLSAKFAKFSAICTKDPKNGIALHSCVVFYA